ncbi:MAG: hypothetical protein RMJ56_11910 [Gemmataceae bacterium]|nr:hypothetical protein [Gemmata sp.]MDW8198297.1 hypothetical protein [Gemmataceae bacterium]
MTESQWYETTDLWEIYHRALAFRVRKTDPYPQITRRVAVLIGLACLRATPQVQRQTFVLQAMEVAEAAVENNQWQLLDDFGPQAQQNCYDAVAHSGIDTAPHFWALAAFRLVDRGIELYGWHVPYFVLKAIRRAANIERMAQLFAHLLRDLLGNPFRGGRGEQFEKRRRKRCQTTFFPPWRTSDVMLLAQGIYAERAFQRMPILADALQEAGCDDDAILSHLRDSSLLHDRGCWVIDLVLNRS